MAFKITIIQEVNRPSVDKNNIFDWSLKPLDFCARIFVGIPLDFGITNQSSLPTFLQIAFLLLAILNIILNLLINGPRGIDIANFEWMEKIKEYDSPFIYFRENPDYLLQLVIDTTSIIFYLTVPLMHLVFLVTVFLSRKWRDLVEILQEIQNEVELNKEFHQKCRRRCIIALLLSFLVKKCIFVHFKSYILLFFKSRMSRFFDGNILNKTILYTLPMKNGNRFSSIIMGVTIN